MKKNLAIALLVATVVAQGLALKEEQETVDTLRGQNKRLVRIGLYLNKKLSDLGTPWDQFDDIAVKTILEK